MDDDGLGFDPLDATLGERLRAAQPALGDVDATLAGLRPRMARARRRHRAVVATVSGLGIAAVIAIGAVVLQPGGGADVKTPPATRPDATPTTRSTTDTTVPVTPDTGPGDTTPGTTPTTIDDHGGGSGSGSGSGSSGSGSSGSGSSGSGSSGSGSSGSGGGG